MMRRIIHKLIQWYLRRCGGAFHTSPYGPKGRYVVLMNEDQYHWFRCSQPAKTSTPMSAEELWAMLSEDDTPCTVHPDGSVTW